MKKPMKLKTKLTLLIISVVFISISVIIAFVISWMTNNIESKAKTNIINVGEIIAHSTEIRKALENKDPNKIIGPYVADILKTLEQVEYIIVVDMEETRYSHPNPELIGEKFVGGDEYRVLKNHETYISEATGTLGKALRAFVPIYNNNNEEIGFVAVGTLTTSIENTKRAAIGYTMLIAIGGLIIGILGALLLSHNIKKTLLGLEPEEIARLYHEKMGIIDAIYEGLIAIDNKGKITIINDSAIKIIQLENSIDKNQFIGANIDEAIPSTRLLTVMETGISEYEKEQTINDTIILTNRVPIKSGGKIVGAIATFRDKTELTRLAEELTGVKQIVEALRVNNHEFMNKLHVILGLIYINELEEVKRYITNITEEHQKLFSGVTNKIKNSTIAALVLGKFGRAKELAISLTLDENSNLESYNKNINNNALVTIIGNLVENAMEAVSKSTKKAKIVNLRIQEADERIEIEVADSGVGIEKENINRIFERGYTTKEGSKGIGLAIIKESIDNLHGEISIKSEVNKGTTIKVSLPLLD
jgi:sensor histidine kinase regulating citrate/malate metabolism